MTEHIKQPESQFSKIVRNPVVLIFVAALVGWLGSGTVRLLGFGGDYTVLETKFTADHEWIEYQKQHIVPLDHVQINNFLTRTEYIAGQDAIRRELDKIEQSMDRIELVVTKQR